MILPAPRAILFILCVLIAAGGLAACDESDGSSSSSPNGSAVDGDVVVFAAASLTDAFAEIGEAFEAANPDANVTLNFGGSQELRTQLGQGARADVFASANATQMNLAVDAGVVDPASDIFAGNRLVVIVPAGNAVGLETLLDLANDGILLVLANEDVPVGEYARAFLEKASNDPAFRPDYADDVLANLVSEEPNVRQVAAKVQLGEADAGIVYSSDVTSDLTEDVETIEIPDALNEVAMYPIALTSEPENEAGARAFVAFVLSAEGQAILESYGFLPVQP